MKIEEVHFHPDYTLEIVADDGRVGIFDVTPYLKYEAFAELKDRSAFMQISNRGYFIEWDCGADLSADTIKARWQLKHDEKASTHKKPVQRAAVAAPDLIAQADSAASNRTES